MNVSSHHKSPGMPQPSTRKYLGKAFPAGTADTTGGNEPAHVPQPMYDSSYNAMQVHSSVPGSSPRGGGAVLGQGPHWDVSHTKPAHSRDFSIGSGSLVQHSTGSMTSVGTHLGSVAGLGHVSATYSPLSHQGSLLRKDVDNQKNIRQADLNAVKRTPLSLKVVLTCCLLGSLGLAQHVLSLWAATLCILPTCIASDPARACEWSTHHFQAENTLMQ